MSLITLIVGAALTLSIVSVLLLIWFSEEGHEDEKGFHPGADSKSPDAQAADVSKIEQPDVAPLGVTVSIETKR